MANAKGAVSSAVAAAEVAAGGDDGAKGISGRDYWWWQCQEICKPAQYKKILKGKLKTLYTITFDYLTKSGADATTMANLNTIFRDKIETLQSYNLKALQVCVLLTEHAINRTDPGNYNLYARRKNLPGPGKAIQTELKALYATPMYGDLAGLEKFIRSRKNSIFDALLVEEGGGAGGGCCPVVPGTAIATPLGTMTFMELLESLNQDIFLIGVVMDFTQADGYDYSPLEFFAHDLFHRRYRFESLGSKSEDMPKVKQNVKDFLDHLRSISNPHVRYIGEMILFMIQHEALSDSQLLKEKGKIPTPHGVGWDVAWAYDSWITDRYGPLIPEDGPFALKGKDRKNISKVTRFLNEACGLFVELWAGMPEGGAGAAGGAASNPYEGIANKNAANWNAMAFGGGQRRRRTRRSKKMKV